MASTSPAPARPASRIATEPKISHSFDGDVKLLNNTFDCRMELRKALSDLQQLLQRLEGRNVQVAAEIRLRVDGPDAKEHTYSVSVNDPKLNVDSFVKQFPSAAKNDTVKSPSSSAQNGQHSQSLGRRESRDPGSDDDVIEVRPPKRLRTEVGDDRVSMSHSRGTDGLSREALSLLKQQNSNATLDFVCQWHAEWVKQGGWLFDTMNKAEKLAVQNQGTMERRMANVQDVLGQSINAASASTMQELTSVSKLIPWLEACRKSAADKAQAREEKWRTSSATFHDQNRRDRETAEEGLQEELKKQRVLLEKIARASGVDVDEVKKEVGTPGEDREASLGAQLTAELNLEANRANEMGVNAAESQRARETIDLDDD